MGQLAKESVGESDVVENLERRRMDRVAAKVSKKVRVLFQHDDRDAGSREQEAQHRASRPAAGDTAAGGVRHTICVSGSRGMISAHTTYSSRATGPVTSVATAQVSRTSVGSRSKYSPRPPATPASMRSFRDR